MEVQEHALETLFFLAPRDNPDHARHGTLDAIGCHADIQAGSPRGCAKRLEHPE